MACCVQVVEPFCCASVMMWGGFYGEERTPQVTVNSNVTAQRSIHNILRSTVQQQLRGVIYQHDNARRHTARIVQHCLEANNVHV